MVEEGDRVTVPLQKCETMMAADWLYLSYGKNSSELSPSTTFRCEFETTISAFNSRARSANECKKECSSIKPSFHLKYLRAFISCQSQILYGVSSYGGDPT